MSIKKDLKRIVVLSGLSSEMLEKLEPDVKLLKFAQDETIFQEGDKAKNFYMLKHGKVLLQKNVTNDIMVSISAIKPGYSFGWSAIFKGKLFGATAVAAEFSEVFAINGAVVPQILESDYHMGYKVMQRLTRVLNNRLERMQEKFINVVKEHPDIKQLI